MLRPEGRGKQASAIVRWLFRAIHSFPVRIPHIVFSRPESLEFFYELKSLLAVLARCNVHEFTVLKLPEHAIHDSRTLLLIG
jgi:hypothetical protein